jgi:hypothetical protein
MNGKTLSSTSVNLNIMILNDSFFVAEIQEVKSKSQIFMIKNSYSEINKNTQIIVEMFEFKMKFLYIMNDLKQCI